MPIANVRAMVAGVLAAVFAACTCLCFLIVQQAHDPGNTAPIRWKAYSEAIKDSALRDGKKVLVFVFAELSPESPLALKSIDSAKAAALCGVADFEPLLLFYNNWDDPNIRLVWTDVGHTKNPFLAMYCANEAPKAFDPFSGAALCR